MAGFSELERIIIAAKALAAGVKDADPRSAHYESVNANSFIVTADKVWVQSEFLRQYPAANVTVARTLASGTLSGIVEDLSQPANAVQLTAIPGINNTYVALQTPGDFSSGVLDNWILPQLVPQTNGLPSFGYAIRLYDGDPNSGGTEVLTTDGTTGTGVNKTVAWIFDYATGILLLSDTSNLFSDDPYVNGFVYTGLTVSDLPTTVSGSGADLPPIEFEANCPASIAVDDLVYITGPSVSGLFQVDKVDPTNRAKMPAIGIVTDKITPIKCVVVTIGEVVPGFSLVAGQRYFVGSDGKPSDSMPTPVGTEMAKQIVGYALDTNKLLMLPNLDPIFRRP